MSLAGELLYERQFRNWPGAFRGVYQSFEEAVRAAPPGRVGYDHPELANAYADRLVRPIPSDYPAMFWLQRILDDGARTIFDYGGHVGIGYYSYRNWMRFPMRLEWLVYDLPSMVERGREMAQAEGADALSFTTDPGGADGLEIFCAQGSLQYIEVPLAAVLRRLSNPPAHLMINRVPLTDQAGFITLQNTIHAYTPYAVFNRAIFLESLTSLGYEVVDFWPALELAVHVPSHPACNVPQYSGVYLRRLM